MSTRKAETGAWTILKAVLLDVGVRLTYVQSSDARELVAELEFVWDQIKNNSASSSNSSPGRHGIDSEPRRFQPPQSGSDGPMKVLSPMSQDDEAEMKSERRLDQGSGQEYDDGEYDGPDKEKRKTKQWRRKVEAAIVKMTAEMAALREQIGTGREWRERKRRTVNSWIVWLLWATIRHILLDGVLLGILLLWMRKRKDRRLEDLLKEVLRAGKEYVRKIIPPR